ncbi:MAG: hypothetical protein LBW85_07885 [Deltaproteobacteria bacterium]|jgi:hypothetical protein|nr:hypothetical protein [Deltaproteobacteria bacterium]
MPELDDSALAPSREVKASLGGREITLYECRPCDLPFLFSFMKEFSGAGKKIGPLLKPRLEGSVLTVDAESLLSFLKDKPEAVCRLLAALTDPEPFSEGSAAWVEAETARLMRQPISQIASAAGGWLKLNAPFLAREWAQPGIEAVIAFVAAVQRLTEGNLNLLRSSPSGSA